MGYFRSTAPKEGLWLAVSVGVRGSDDRFPERWGRMSVTRWMVVVGLLSTLPAVAFAQSEQDSLRTAWGHPDLPGVWDFSSDTPLNRPAEFEGRAFLTDEEVAQRQYRTTQARTNQDNNPAPAGSTGTYNRFWTDHPRSSRQTSLVVDPPDGRVPPLTPAALQYLAELEDARRGVDLDAPTPGGFVEDLGPRGLFVRCITGFNSGPPMVPQSYNQNVQVFQTPDHVVLLNEMVHSARVVPLDGRPPLPSGIRQWLGRLSRHLGGRHPGRHHDELQGYRL